MAQVAERLTLDFGPSRIKGAWAGAPHGGRSLLGAISPSLCPFPAHALALSQKKFFWWKTEFREFKGMSKTKPL